MADRVTEAAEYMAAMLADRDRCADFLREARNEHREIREKNRSSPNQWPEIDARVQPKIHQWEMELALCTSQYQEAFASWVEAVRQADAERTAQLAERQIKVAEFQQQSNEKAKRFNLIVGIFVIISGLGTVAQAIAAWRGGR